jgi:hypothetical protein
MYVDLYASMRPQCDRTRPLRDRNASNTTVALPQCVQMALHRCSATTEVCGRVKCHRELGGRAANNQIEALINRNSIWS